MKQNHSMVLSNHVCLAVLVRLTKVLGHAPMTEASSHRSMLSSHRNRPYRGRRIQPCRDIGKQRQGAGYKSRAANYRESSKWHRRSQYDIWIATQACVTTVTHPRTSLSCQTRRDTPQSKYGLLK